MRPNSVRRKKQKRRYACLLDVGVVAIFLTMERSVLCATVNATGQNTCCCAALVP